MQLLFDEQAQDRREFLSAAAACLGLLVIPTVSFGAEAKTFDPRSYIAGFPSAAELPGVAKIQTVLPDQACRVLCVCEQVHWCDGISTEELPYVEQVQSELLSLYPVLSRHPSIAMPVLYVEGIYHNAEHEIIDQKRRLQSEHRKLTSKQPVHTGVSSFIPFFESTPPAELRSTISTAAYIGAAETLHLQGKLQIRGAENKEIYLKTFELEETGTQEELDSALFTEREDALLNFTGATNEAVSFAVYGCNHNFRDNMADFNAARDDKVGLIIITPNGVESYRRRFKLETHVPVE